MYVSEAQLGFCAVCGGTFDEHPADSMSEAAVDSLSGVGDDPALRSFTARIYPTLEFGREDVGHADPHLTECLQLSQGHSAQ